jgi:hypothetical protein
VVSPVVVEECRGLEFFNRLLALLLELLLR